MDQVKFETDLIGFKKHISDASKMENGNGNEILLKLIVPYLYEIKKRTCKISNVSRTLFTKLSNDIVFNKFGAIGKLIRELEENKLEELLVKVPEKFGLHTIMEELWKLVEVPLVFPAVLVAAIVERVLSFFIFFLTSIKYTK